MTTLISRLHPNIAEALHWRCGAVPAQMLYGASYEVFPPDEISLLCYSSAECHLSAVRRIMPSHCRGRTTSWSARWGGLFCSIFCPTLSGLSCHTARSVAKTWDGFFDITGCFIRTEEDLR